MSTSENLYEGAGDSIAVLRRRFLSLADNNYCAAFLLDRFVAEIASREEYAWFDGNSMNYHVDYSVHHLTTELFGLFTEQEVIDALNLLIDKQFIGNHGKVAGTERYDFEIYRKRINDHSEAYWQQIKSQRAQAEVKQQVHPLPPPPPPTPEEIAREQKEAAQIQRQQILRRESDRVKTHVKRATKAGLPATLTLEEWLETLEYFEWKCAYCGGEYCLLEHYIPLSHYAGTTRENCVPACHTCNGIKQAWHPERIPYNSHKHGTKLQNGIVRVREYLEALGKVE